MDQPKLQRLLRIMQLLTDKSMRYTINEIAEILDLNPRSVYRYINTFESVGFIVIKDGGKVWLAKESKHFRTIADIVYFTEEEAYILKSAVEVLDPLSPAVNSIKTKLYSLYDYKKVANIVVSEKIGDNVNKLLDSIAKEKQVVLKNYRSSHSGNISDRLVEPIQFGENMVNILCYELSSDSCKYFKVARIDEVIQTEEEWSNLERHEKVITDAFNISTNSNEKYNITLKLSMNAANLLAEEYPLTIEKIENISDNEYLYKDEVCSYEGVGRFVLGLCNEVEVIDSPGFLEFLKKKTKASLFATSK